MNIFGKKLCLTAVMLVFCVFSISSAQETTDENISLQEEPAPQVIDDTEALAAFNTMKEALIRYDFETVWGMVSQAERQEKFEGDIEILKASFNKPERFDKIVKFEVDRTEILSPDKIKLISKNNKFAIMVKEGASWKYGGKGSGAAESGKAKGKTPKGAKPTGRVKNKPVEKNQDDMTY